jgi:hypothetical protein
MRMANGGPVTLAGDTTGELFIQGPQFLATIRTSNLGLDEDGWCSTKHGGCLHKTPAFARSLLMVPKTPEELWAFMRANLRGSCTLDRNSCCDQLPIYAIGKELRVRLPTQLGDRGAVS